MISRRRLLQVAGLAAAAPLACTRRRPASPLDLNDVHSKLNPTRVAEVAVPRSVEELARRVVDAAERELPISVAGGRHAMGGQQFGTDTLHLDTRRLDRVLGFDPGRGRIEVEAGIEWPALVGWMRDGERPEAAAWGIRQKQTGADRMTLGGALAANVHGRGLTLQPIVGDVVSLTLLDADGNLQRLSREESPELFGLVVGGYGLFGVVCSVELELARRTKLRRTVEVRPAEGLAQAFEERIDDGFAYGDFQFVTDAQSEDFLRRGVFSCYRPVGEEAVDPGPRRRLSPRLWRRLLHLAHRDKREAFERYSRYYLSTDGQVYWSDLHQMTSYLDDYHSALDRRYRAEVPGSEMITELYVPRPALARFLGEAAETLRTLGADVIYGTVRLIESEAVTFLPWARERWACIVLNLHVDHSQAGIERARTEFRALIDLAISHGGSFYLTYHRWATREQVEACYPRLPELLRLKRRHDPEERFQSDWYRHYREMFADRL